MNPTLRTFLLICAGLFVAFYAQAVLAPQAEFPWIVVAILCLALLFKPSKPAAAPTQPPQEPATLEALERQLAATGPLRWLAAAEPQAPPLSTPAVPPNSGPWGETKPKTATSAQAQTKASKASAATNNIAKGWVHAGQEVVIKGRKIAGMVYVGPTPQTAGRTADIGKGWIDPTLAVASHGQDIAGAGMPYWPSYASIPPINRATYLGWLAGGCRDDGYNAGYLFLYFYGLERRYFCDAPSETEKQQIIAEVLRLKDVFQSNGSVQRYLAGFLDFARCSDGDIPDTPPELEQRWELPLQLRLGLGTKIVRGEPLDAEWLFAWFMAHPDRNLRTAAKRCAPELRALFAQIFDQRFPEGLTVKPPRKHLLAIYRAASGDFEVQYEPKTDGKPVPDVADLRSPMETAQQIVDAACEALDKLSRFLGRNPAGRDSLEAQALMPAELLAQFPSTALDGLKDWAKTATARGLVPATEVISQLEGAVPDRLGRRQLTDAADALARIGFGLAPDPRFSLRAPRLEEPVVIFALAAPLSRLEDASDAYRLGLLQIALAVLVAQADGKVQADERESLVAQIAALPIQSPDERRLLAANLGWMLAVPPDMALLRGRLAAISAEQKAGMRAALTATASADGVITSSEVAQLERIYALMGLDAALLYADLHSGSTTHPVTNEPIQVRQASPAIIGEPIPAARLGISLDPARIAAIKADTAQAARLLGEVFSTETEDEPAKPAAATQSLGGLNPRLTAFVRHVISAPTWDESALAALAARHALMPEGAVEAVNEWSFAQYDAALLELYDGYEVNPTIVAELAGKPAMEA